MVWNFWIRNCDREIFSSVFRDSSPFFQYSIRSSSVYASLGRGEEVNLTPCLLRQGGATGTSYTSLGVNRSYLWQAVRSLRVTRMAQGGKKAKICHYEHRYLQLSSSKEQVWESRGKWLKSMLHMAVTVILEQSKHVSSCSDRLTRLSAHSKEDTDTARSGCLLPGAWRPESLSQLFFFWAPCGPLDLISPTRDRTRVPCVGGTES